jgi:hypothetical protein
VTSVPGHQAGDAGVGADTRGIFVELTFLWDPELLSLARFTSSTVASRLDFTIDDIEDVRLAIDELCMACTEGAGQDAQVRLCFEGDGQTLRIECAVDHVVEVSGAVDENLLAGMTAGELSRRILGELVDSYEVGAVVAGTRKANLEKRRTSASS